MTMKRRTRANPKGLSQSISAASATMLGKGVEVDSRFAPLWVTSAPTDEADGFDVKDWNAIHVTAVCERAPASVDLCYARIRVWRYYKTHPSRLTDARTVGRWVQDYDRIYTLNQLSMLAESQHRVYATRNADKMCLQIVEVTAKDANGVPTTPVAADILWIHVQPWGLIRKDEQVPFDITSDPALTTLDVETDVIQATHDAPVEAEGIHPMLEAFTFDGGAVPNAVDAEGDAVRALGSLQGVAFTTLVTPNARITPVSQQSEVLAVPNAGVVMGGVEAKNSDGAAFPNDVPEGCVTRIAASRYGVQYTMPVNQDGSATPIVPDETTPSAAAGGLANMMMGAVARSVQDDALANTESTHLVTNLFRELATAAFDWASQADRTEEQDPLDTRDVQDFVIDVTNLAADGPFYVYLSMQHKQCVSIQTRMSDGSGAGDDLELTIQASNTTGVAPAAIPAGDWGDVTVALTGGATIVNTAGAVNRFDNTAHFSCEWLRFAYRRTGGVANDGDIYVRVKRWY